MQIQRLTEIVFALLKNKRMTAKMLAERFEVSTRTIYCDLDVLSAAGVPIFTEKGNGGGIEIDEEYALKTAMLSKEEKQELVNLLSVKIAVCNTMDTGTLMDKLSGLFRTSEQSILVDFSSFCNGEARSQILFDTVNQCVIEHCTLTFDYYNANGAETSRTVEPLKLIYKSRAWYLYAFCTLRQENRIFKLHRMSNARKGVSTFQRRFDRAEFDRIIGSSSVCLKIRLRIDGSQKARVYDEFDREKTEKNEDGSFNVEMNSPYDNWVESFILGFGNKIKVLEPLWLRDRIIEMHQAAIDSVT